MRYLNWAPALLFILAVPLLLVSASVAWAVNDPGVYHRGFEKYRISSVTGITDADLLQVGADIRRYFNSREEPLAVRTRIYGEERELFNQREVLHMWDVKRLIWGVYGVGAASALYLLGAVTVGVLRQRRASADRLAWRTLQGGALTLGLVLAVGVFALVGFDTLFLWFHQVSFANDLWRLDPRTDYLIILFPQGFWFDATMRVATLTVVGAAALSAASGGYLLYRYLAAPTGEARALVGEAETSETAPSPLAGPERR